MVVVWEINCFQKNQQNHLFGLWPHSFPKDCVCVFCFFLGIKRFSGPKPSFSYEKFSLEKDG